MNFDKEGSKFEKKKTCVSVYVCVCVCVWREEGGALTPKLYAKLCHLRSYLHNVEHVVKLTRRNLKTLILSSLLSKF